MRNPSHISDRRPPGVLGALPAMAGSLWTHREILRNFVARGLKVKYHQSFLGYLWSLIEPLTYMAVYYFIFIILAGRPEPVYPLLILLGVLTWRLFSGLVQELSQVLVKNAGLIKRVYFPREVFIFASAGYHVAAYALSLLVVVPLLFYFRLVPTWRLAGLPLAALLALLLAIGIGFAASCLHARARDTGEIVRLLVQVGFWFSPIIYTLDRVPAAWRDPYLLANPMAVVITLVRAAVTGQPSGLAPYHLIWAAVLAVAFFVAGAAVFRRWEGKAVKYL